MAVDPAIRREQNRINKQVQRARDALIASGARVPKALQKQRPGRGDRQRETPRQPSYTNPQERALDAANTLIERQASALAQLRSIRNMGEPKKGLRQQVDAEGRLIVPIETQMETAWMEQPKKTRPAQLESAQRIRDHSNATRLAVIGKERKAQLELELHYGADSDRYETEFTPEQQHRFQELSERIAGISHQALGILFAQQGGQDDYNAALERMKGSPDSVDVEEGLNMLETLAELAEVANRHYSPASFNPITGKRVGIIRV